MAKMTLHKRIGLFHVDITGFKTNCLPFPEKILEAIGRHLPVIAAKRNDVLLNVIKVRQTDTRSLLLYFKWSNGIVSKYSLGVWKCNETLYHFM